MNQTFIWLESILFTVAVVLYLLSTILYFVSFVSKKEKEGLTKEDIKDLIESNPYVIDEV